MLDEARRTKPAPVTIIRKNGSTGHSHGADRGYRWAPFTKGNLAALRHGAFSERILSARSAEVCKKLVATCPWILESDALAIEQFCRNTAKMDLLTEYAMEVVESDGVGAVKPYIWREINKAESNAIRLLETLALAPSGRVKILKGASCARHRSS